MANEFVAEMLPGYQVVLLASRYDSVLDAGAVRNRTGMVKRDELNSILHYLSDH